MARSPATCRSSTAVGAKLDAAAAQRLSTNPAFHAVSLNADVKSQGNDFDDRLVTSYNESIQADEAWDDDYTGKGVGVAVIDTGIQGDLPDFRESRTNSASRVIATAVVNPGASTAKDTLGHGTHVAGLIAGDGTARPYSDPLRGRYVGVAPDANLIAVKAADDEGNTSVLDVIDGLQFVVDHKDDYNIRVVNLSLRSTQPESYLTDPLDAAVEAAWNAGIVVVVAAGNEGTAADAVSYAPANDPYVITVGGVDDKGTDNTSDDALAAWSSRGTTQDGFAKPDVLAPGARMVSTIPAGSDYTELCPTCVVDGQYFQVGGTSMSAAVVSGAAANLIQARPSWTPDQIKTQLVKRTSAGLRAEDDDSRQRARDHHDSVDDQDDRRRGGRCREGTRVQPPEDLGQRRPHAERADRPGHRPDRLHPRLVEPRELVECDRLAACFLEPGELVACLLEPRFLERDAGELCRVRACLLEPGELVSCQLEPRLAGAARAGARTACPPRSSPPRTTARSTRRSLPLRRSARSCSARSIRPGRAGLAHPGVARAGRRASTSRSSTNRIAPGPSRIRVAGPFAFYAAGSRLNGSGAAVAEASASSANVATLTPISRTGRGGS